MYLITNTHDKGIYLRKKKVIWDRHVILVWPVEEKNFLFEVWD